MYNYIYVLIFQMFIYFTPTAKIFFYNSIYYYKTKTKMTKDELEQKIFEFNDRKGKELFNIIFKYLNPSNQIELTHTDCPIDGYILSGKTKYSVEVKIRNCSINDYPTWKIEEKKYTALRYENWNVPKGLYINFFNDGLMYWIIDGNTENITWKKELNPKTTNGSNEYILKQMGYLSSNDGWKKTITCKKYLAKYHQKFES